MKNKFYLVHSYNHSEKPFLFYCSILATEKAKNLNNQPASRHYICVEISLEDEVTDEAFKYNLDAEEKQILEDFENGEFRSIENKNRAALAIRLLDAASTYLSDKQEKANLLIRST